MIYLFCGAQESTTGREHFPTSNQPTNPFWQQDKLMQDMLPYTLKCTQLKNAQTVIHDSFLVDFAAGECTATAGCAVLR